MYYLYNSKKNVYSLFSKKNILTSKGNKNKFINSIKIFDKTIEGNKFIFKDTKKYKEYKKRIVIN